MIRGLIVTCKPFEQISTEDYIENLTLISQSLPVSDSIFSVTYGERYMSCSGFKLDNSTIRDAHNAVMSKFTPNIGGNLVTAKIIYLSIKKGKIVEMATFDFTDIEIVLKKSLSYWSVDVVDKLLQSRDDKELVRLFKILEVQELVPKQDEFLTNIGDFLQGDLSKSEAINELIGLIDSKDSMLTKSELVTIYKSGLVKSVESSNINFELERCVTFTDEQACTFYLI